MTAQRLAGVLIILGILLALVASVVFPGDYYRAKSDEARQAILDANRSAWLATNWLWIAATAATASGLALIAQRNRDWLSYTGAGLFAVGSLFWVAYLYLRWLNPSIATDRLWMEGVFASLNGRRADFAGYRLHSWCLPEVGRLCQSGLWNPVLAALFDLSQPDDCVFPAAGGLSDPTAHRCRRCEARMIHTPQEFAALIRSRC